ncbi:MAG: HAD hydrolase-like protein [Acidobacteriia bacterium]|nr:HAD hydrolase-like protein [Terriglobia bacterium]
MLKINRQIRGDDIRLVIFDLDGTLVDSRVDLANSVNGMLRHFGKPELPIEVIAGYIGDGAPMLIRRALGDPDDETFLQTALEFFLAYYREHKLDTTVVYGGVFDALRAIRICGNGAGLERRMAVLSNKPVNPSRAIVEALGLAEFFTQIYGGNSFPTKKPDPLGALTLARENAVEPRQALIVGDSGIDVLTARNAGMWSCGVTYGFAPHSLEQAPPDVMVDSPLELPLLFEKM